VVTGQKFLLSRVVLPRVIRGKNYCRIYYEAIEACLSAEVESVQIKPEDKVLEIAV